MSTSKYNTLTVEQLATFSKMRISIHVMKNIMDDRTIPENQRTTVFKSVMMSLGMTKAGCYTYARNIRIHMEGGDLYASNKQWSDKQKKSVDTTPEVVIETPEPEVMVDLSKRWCVEDLETKTILDSFTSRSSAQDYNKQLKSTGHKTRWFDSKSA